MGILHMGKESQCHDIENNKISSIINAIKEGLKGDSYSIIYNPIYKVEYGEEIYELSPACSICRGVHHIADIYDLSEFSVENRNEEITKICRYTNFDNRNLYYLFFFDNTFLKGQHLFHSKDAFSCPKKNYVDILTDYTENYIENLWPTSVDDMLIRIKTIDETTIIEKIIADIKAKVTEWFNAHGNVPFREPVLNLMEQWQYYTLIIKATKFSIVPKEEDNLFLAILGKIEAKEVYRYVRNNTLEYIVRNGTHAMSSVACMNDKSECYYASNYLFGNNENEDSANNHSLDYILNYEDFITSFSLCPPNELTMWRLYGDESKGVCIEYDISNLNLPPNFHIAPVSYPQDNGQHLELEFIKYLTNEMFDYHKLVLSRWNVWQRFFKPRGFKVEKEIRLLFHPKETIAEKTQWVFANGIYSPIYMFSLKEKDKDYPLNISKIILGSRFPAQDVNKILIEKRFKEYGLTVYVETSIIDYYRVNEK